MHILSLNEIHGNIESIYVNLILLIYNIILKNSTYENFKRITLHFLNDMGEKFVSLNNLFGGCKYFKSRKMYEIVSQLKILLNKMLVSY